MRELILRRNAGLAAVRLLSVAILLAFPPDAAADDSYRFDVINTNNGLPQNTIRAILQTRDGYLWFTTFDGLVRYNGARFEVFNKANSKGINSNRFMSLYEDVDATLWIGTEDGGLTHYANGRFRTYTLDDGLPSNVVDGLLRTSDGELLVVTPRGMARLQGERFEPASADDYRFAPDLVIQGPSGDTWYRTGEALQRIRDGRITSYASQGRGRAFEPVYEDRQGRVWMTFGPYNSPGQLWMLKDEVMTRFSARDGLPGAFFRSICEDREGTMWFGTTNGLIRFKDGSFTTYTTKDGLSSNWIVSIKEDREGTLWIGTEDNGVMRMTRKVLTTISEKDGLRGKVFYPIIEDHSGSIWVGSQGVNRLKDGKFTYYPLNTAPQYVRMRRLYAGISSFGEDREGRLWIGHESGLYRFQNEEFTYDQQMTTRGLPYAIFQDSKGAFWFGFSGWLTRYHNGEVKDFSREDGLQAWVQPIYEDRQGRIWIGTYGGLARYVDDRLVFLTEKDGLSSNRVRAIYEDSDGVLWVGTYDGGLNRYKDGRFTSYTTKEGMFSNGVFAILEDQRGNFWMSSNQGIYRVSKQQLNDFADGKIKKIDSVSYGRADGMLNTECNGGRHPSAIKTRDGRLWFPTFDGIAVVDPEAVTFNDVPPPVVIEHVMLDQEELDVRLPIEVKPGQDNLEVHYAGLSFMKPEHMQFKYRLEGLDADWVEAGNRRVAYFPHLPGGKYVFHVIAANSDGVWNEVGAMLTVTVIPPFWRRPVFVALASLSLVTILVLVFRRRIIRLQRAKEAQEAFSRQLIASQEQERKRIATGLHDSLGQQLLVIKNWAMIELSATREDGSSREGLNEISTTASQAIEEVREIIYDLRPYQLDKIGLASTIRFMVEKVAAASKVNFDVAVDDIDGLFSYDSEITLYRVVQECVNNIVKHAHATGARVAIERNGSSINITIEDNGCGFEQEAARASDSRSGGLGLTGITERVRILGGKRTIESSPGAGTTIAITIQAPHFVQEPR
ncbi:MAG TPA: two-component regulator propeller domain-containing protein [Blastocatellia bacterium]|nr:two-component regulator propeller domain-containing protein [Blastocatellia bacterium]